MSSKTFTTTIFREGSMCFIPLGFAPKPVFGKVRAPVRVTLNGYTYRSTIAAMGGPPCIPLRRSHREAAGLEGGETLEVRLDLDTEKREVKPPADFVKALKAAPPAWNRWRELSFSHQREYAQAIEEAKKPETRARRIVSAVLTIKVRPKKRRLRGSAVLVLAALALSAQASAQTPMPAVRPVVIQGAMQIEVATLAGRLEHATTETVGGWTFWRGTVDGYPVIVSKTLKGMSNAAAATVIAVERYHPVAIINQGTAGGHDPELHNYDIVLGTTAVNLGAFRTPYRPAGAGSNTLDWTPLDLTASDGSAASSATPHTLASFKGDGALLAAARRVKPLYTKGRIVEGVIGSSDIWNDELDRIARLHAAFGTAVEEMETASAAQIAGLLGVPLLGIRVVSDNATNGGAYDPRTSEACEDYVYQVVKAYIGTLKR